MNDADIFELARAAGIEVDWIDAYGRAQSVTPDKLRIILNALELPSASDAQLRDSLTRIATENADTSLPPLITGDMQSPLHLPSDLGWHGCTYRLEFENGGHIEGRFANDVSLPLELPPLDRYGYHHLLVGSTQTIIAIAPARCFGVADALANPAYGSSGQGGRLWGLAAQLYGLRREGDAGIGDFTALEMLARSVASKGAAAVAISPVHAMFSADTSRFSPYGPSSRLFLNAYHIDPATVLGEDAYARAKSALGGDAAEESARLEQVELIDWPAATGLRLRLLRKLYQEFRQRRSDFGKEFDSFSYGSGQSLTDHARFEALHAWFSANGRDGVNGYWRTWPDAFRNPRSAEVAAFADQHSEEVEFHTFLQWQAARGLSGAQRAARDAGMPIGLISDLAVGADNGGSQAWSRQKELLNGLSIGAPPDNLNALGQSWGLGAFSPRALKARGFQPYIEMLRAAFAHAGGIRIDHVLGLARLWLVPDGASADHGAYLRFPIDDLLRLIALESWRHHCIVIGEDLGTIPPGFGDKLAQAGVLGIRVLLFQRDGNRFISPGEWSPHAIATTTTHDTPTLAGWWGGRDISWRSRLDLRQPDQNEADESRNRSEERLQLWHALKDAQCANHEMPSPAAEDAPITEAIGFFGATQAPLAILPLEDALGLPEQPNLPGTVDVHPNWRRRMPSTVDRLLNAPDTAARLAVLQAARNNIKNPS